MREKERIAELEARCAQQEEKIAELERSLVLVAEIVRKNNDHLHDTMLSVVEHERIIRLWQQYEAEG